MSTVQYLNSFVDRRLVQKLFVRFANKYGNLWTSRLGEHGDWKGCEDDWLEELSAFTVNDAVEAIKKSLIIYKDYPPTQGQLIDLCLTESGVPSVDDVIKLMVARDFTHPLVKLVYDKVGGWTLTNGKVEEVRSKTKAHYGECLAVFKQNPDEEWAKLSVLNEQLRLPPAEQVKVATPGQRKGFKEHLEEAKLLAAVGKLKLKDMKPIEFDPDKTNPGGEQYDDYCKYLLSVPEHLVLGIPPVYAYDRQRLLNAKDTVRHLRESGFVPPEERVENGHTRSANGRPTKMYKNWVD